MNWSTREHGSWQEGWSPTWPRSPLGEDPVRARHSLRSGAVFSSAKNCSSEGASSESVRIMMKRAPRSWLPCTQRHAEFEVALRSFSRDDRDDHSRIHTATRSNCSFLCILIRQVARLVKQGNSSRRSCRPNAPHIQVFLTGDSDSGTFHRYSFQWPDALGEEPFLSVGVRAPCN